LPDAGWQHDLTSIVSQAVYLRTMGRNARVEPMLDEAVDQFRALGQNQAAEISLAVRGFFAETGGLLRTARADWEELLVSARRRDNTEHVVWGMALLVPLLLDLGRRREALSMADRA